jgi:hypothetical protein
MNAILWYVFAVYAVTKASSCQLLLFGEEIPPSTQPWALGHCHDKRSVLLLLQTKLCNMCYGNSSRKTRCVTLKMHSSVNASFPPCRPSPVCLVPAIPRYPEEMRVVDCHLQHYEILSSKSVLSLRRDL